ncbi:MAG: hypothetical protein SFV81_14015 [Pirellulaceae bacterium]|nr:hypothetical protein [Pirellulaceae bacterium]
MSSSPRLSELIGISSHKHIEEQEPAWLLNLVLFALGGVVIWIAFSYLQIDDPRLQYNPWSYAVVTPLVLVGLSLLLRNITSRGVERSLQIAFLLSLLIHLLMSLYAGNVVIFARMWPDIFEELAAERKVLERQTQPAPRYYNIASPRSEKRPDYLRYVPTTHSPTELKDNSEVALQLAMSHKPDLVSPKPDIEKSPTPHLVPREKSQLPPPQANDRMAALSRSESKLPRPSLSAPEASAAAAESASPEPMRPADASGERGRTSGATLRSDFTASAAPKAAAALSLDRRDAFEPTPMADTRIPKSRTNEAPPLKKRSTIDVPDSPTTIAEATPDALASSESSATGARLARDSMPSIAAPSNTPKLNPSLPKNNDLARRADRAAELRVPSPAAGDTPSAFARESAGGRSSTAAPRSLPIRGVDSLAMPEPGEPDLDSSLSSLALRNSQIQRSTSGLPNIGLPQSEMTSRLPGLSNGTDGSSNVALPQRAGQGAAASDDVAGMTGAGRSIQKSTVGTAGRAGPIAIPTPDAGAGSEAEVAGLNPTEAGTGRGETVNPNYGSLGLPGIPGEGVAPTRAAGVPQGLARASDSFTLSANETTSTSASNALSRQSIDRNPRVAGAIAVPDAAELMEASSPGDLRASGDVGFDSRMGSSSASLTPPSEVGGLNLDIKADLGRGGLADLTRDGVVVPRSGRMPEPLPMMEIDSQRFSRQEIGGPLAAGSSIPLPKPAFKQRLDRLKDNQSMDDTAWGPQTEQAIEAGLEFLAKHQAESGAWRLQDFDTKVLIRSDTAATALSLLSFQGAGYTHQQYQYAENVGKALQFLVSNQRPNGDLYKPEDPASDQNAWLYSHAIAALALCEAYGMTQDPALREPAQKAINFMVESQDKQRGGWRYRPGNGTDTSVSGWFMMAFKSGQLAGLDVPTPTFDRIEKYLDQSQVSQAVPHLYRYNPFAADTPEQRHGREPTPVMTSAGLLMRLYFGWQRGQKEMTAGADYLLEHPPAPGTKDATLRDTYYWYYSTQVLFHMGGERWKKWNSTLYPMLIETQVTEGPNAGSWDPYQPTADLWAKYGGRLYVTTLNLLSLEVNYRHLPLYDATAK